MCVAVRDFLNLAASYQLRSSLSYVVCTVQEDVPPVGAVGLIDALQLTSTCLV